MFGTLAGPAAAKLPQLRFEQPRADAGTTVRAAILLSHPRQLEQLRFFLVHGHDLSALLPPGEWMLFGKKALTLARDDRLVEIHPVPVRGNETGEGWNSLDIAIPDGIRPSSYTTATFVCDRGCVLQLALTPHRMAVLRSISKWNRRFALLVDESPAGRGDRISGHRKEP